MHHMAAGPTVGGLVDSLTETDVGLRAMTRLMPIWALPRLTALQPTLLMVHQQIKALGRNPIKTQGWDLLLSLFLYPISCHLSLLLRCGYWA